MAKSNKLDKMEKEDFNALVPQFDEMGGYTFPFPGNKNTVAIRPSSCGRNPRFFKVSMSYCSDKDKFSRKRGAYEAMLKNMTEEFMLVPSYGQDAFTVAQKISDFMQ